MRKLLFTLLTLLLVAAPAAPAAAQVPSFFTVPTTPIFTSLVADNTSPALVIKYIGTTGYGKVAVTGNAITLTSGAAGVTADTTIECPLSAPYGGVIDLTNAACDTMGEVVDVINSTSGSMWRAYPVGGLRTDTLYATNQKINDISATASGENGVTIYWDTNVALRDTVVMGPTTYGFFFDKNNTAVENPYSGAEFCVLSVDSLATNASADNFLSYYDVELKFNSANGKYAETATLIRFKAGGATATWANDAPLMFGICGKPGHKVMVRLTGTAQATIGLLAYGEQLRPQGH